MRINKTDTNSDRFTLKDKITFFISATALVLSIGARINQHKINHQHVRPKIHIDLNHTIAASVDKAIATYDKDHLLLKVTNKGPAKAAQLSLSGYLYSYDKNKREIVIASELEWNPNEHKTFWVSLTHFSPSNNIFPLSKDGLQFMFLLLSVVVHLIWKYIVSKRFFLLRMIQYMT